MRLQGWRSAILLSALLVGLLGWISFAETEAQADVQNWPTKPIHAIVPFTPGSAADIVPHTVFEPLSHELGQSIIVENRAGAGGTIGAGIVARADPSGSSVLINSSAHTIIPALYSHMPYDTAHDFVGVVPLGSLPNVLVVAPSKGFKTLGDLVTAAKAKPGTMTYASAGVGSATHFSAERLRLSAWFEGVHVPFRGSPEAATEVMTGRVDFFFGPLPSVLPFIHDGKLQALAVSTPKRGAATLHDVPTTTEVGFTNSDYTFWIAIFAPAQTPRPIVQKLHESVHRTIETANLREKLAQLWVDPMNMEAAELDALVKTEIAVNKAVVSAAHIKVE